MKLLYDSAGTRSMPPTTLHDLNQRYIRLADRCRSQWTFYQLLQGLYKHLRDIPCPLDLDYHAIFAELKTLSDELSDSTVDSGLRVLNELGGRIDGFGEQLLAADAEIAPSLVRRFFDRLRSQDEKVILAIVKFYLESRRTTPDILDKLDILFTRLAELPGSDGRSLARQPHEIVRLVKPLLELYPVPTRGSKDEADKLLQAVLDLKSEVSSTRTFVQLVDGGALDRFRALKRELGPGLLDPVLLPAILDTTITLKNRFKELWEEEEPRLLEDTNRVRDLERQLTAHPEFGSPELRGLLETFSTASRRFDQARRDENLRREDVLGLRRTLDRILDQTEATPGVALPMSGGPEPLEVPAPAAGAAIEDEPPAEGGTVPFPVQLPPDPLLHDYINKIVFTLELAGADRSPEETAAAKEAATLRLEPSEVEACQSLTLGRSQSGTLAGQRDLLFLQGAALRVRLDEEAKEIDRLQRRSSDRLAELLERATQSLQRAAEMERRFQWFIEDALYRGETEYLEALFRSRFRLLRAYSGLWLIHNARGGLSPF